MKYKSKMVETKEKLNVPIDPPSKVETNEQSSINNNLSGTITKIPTTTILCPSVYWAQTINTITLKVDLKDAKPPNVRFNMKAMEFEAQGVGARGWNHYKFNIDFFDYINDEESTFRRLDNKIEFIIEKMESGWWPRLVATPQKPHWLKIDFDRWKSEEDMLEEGPRNVLSDYSKEYDRLQKTEIGYIKESTKKVYLLFYNLAQFIGFLYILFVMAIVYFRDGMDAIPKTYETVGNAMKFCQLLQYLEVLHPLFGYTKGSIWVPFMQVNGRNFILFCMIEMEERMQTKPAVFYVFFIWTLVEVFRYPYYITQLIKKDIGILTWLRYTIWIPLYPLGIVCEGIIILRNIPYFEETKRLSIAMPNEWNFVFDMPTFMKIYLLILGLPGTYILMTHMSRTRAKKLGTGKRQTKYID